MKQIEISIPNMQSTHCQIRVNNAVKDIDGVQIQKVEAGKLTISTENSK
jgi:copper chaperone